MTSSIINFDGVWSDEFWQLHLKGTVPNDSVHFTVTYRDLQSWTLSLLGCSFDSSCVEHKQDHEPNRLCSVGLTTAPHLNSPLKYSLVKKQPEVFAVWAVTTRLWHSLFWISNLSDRAQGQERRQNWGSTVSHEMRRNALRGSSIKCGQERKKLREFNIFEHKNHSKLQAKVCIIFTVIYC